MVSSVHRGPIRPEFLLIVIIFKCLTYENVYDCFHYYLAVGNDFHFHLIVYDYLHYYVTVHSLYSCK